MVVINNDRTPDHLQPGGPMYDIRVTTGVETSASFEYIWMQLETGGVQGEVDE